MNTDLFTYTLHLADNALILAQRNSEWTGHGPVLEQDIAITNIALDLFGQARNFYQYAATIFNEGRSDQRKRLDPYLPRVWKGFNREMQEDDLAFLRDEHQYLNLLITELPKGDWALTVLRQFLISAFQYYQYEGLQKSRDSQLAAIAEKSIKEVAYHLKWSAEWVIRLGDGTEESNGRIKNALDDLWVFTPEMFAVTGFEIHVSGDKTGVDPDSIKNKWLTRVNEVFSEAMLAAPAMPKAELHSGGKEGRHTEHLGYLLAEMQYLQRTFPNLTW